MAPQRQRELAGPPVVLRGRQPQESALPPRPSTAAPGHRRSRASRSRTSGPPSSSISQTWPTLTRRTWPSSSRMPLCEHREGYLTASVQTPGRPRTSPASRPGPLSFVRNSESADVSLCPRGRMRARAGLARRSRRRYRFVSGNSAAVSAHAERSQSTGTGIFGPGTRGHEAPTPTRDPTTATGTVLQPTPSTSAMPSATRTPRRGPLGATRCHRVGSSNSDRPAAGTGRYFDERPGLI